MSPESEQEATYNKLIVVGINRLLSSLPQVLSIIIGLNIVAYFVGWICARAYYSEFGAAWLVSEMPIVSLLGYSWIPLVAFVYFVFLGVTDLLESKTRCKWTFFVAKNGWWICIILLIGNGISANYYYSRIAYSLSYISALVFIIVAAAFVEATILYLSISDRRLSSFLIYTTWGIVFVGLYLVPTQIGRTTAERDIDPRLTKLQIVRLHESTDTDLRLLLLSGDRIYAFSTEFEGKYPEIRLLHSSQVHSIKCVDKSKNKSI